MDKVAISMRFTRPMDATIREWRTVLRATMEEVGLYWWRTYTKGHFQRGIQEKYHYQARRPGYQAEKERLWKKTLTPMLAGLPDLVLTGRSYQAAVNTTPTVRGFQNRSKVTFATPDYFRMQPAQPGKPNMGKELTTVPFDEQVDVGRFIEKQIRDRLWKLTLNPQYLTV
jgi:hypothetical protein